ncbi:tetratricopeptide repeat protein [bacterium]|nr:MAG: tetratricopeptide repeat protein [bacterium]
MTALLAALHVVAPLLFFTDLTRNPYFTQIAVLNIGLACALALSAARGLKAERWSWVSTPLDAPWVLTFFAAALSWSYAYWTHPAFYRPSMTSEGLRAAFFLVLNSWGVYVLAAQRPDSDPEPMDVPIGGWAAFALAWGAAWALFPQLRGMPSASNAVWPHIWDPYGAVVWAAGLAAVFLLTRRGRTHDLWHLILVTGFLGAVYGVFQYFGVEFFWPRILNPYGGRSVSTFGNPNFMSSYMVVLLPLAVVYYLHARTRLQKGAYALVVLAIEASLLCSLTRSSWAGAVASLVPLAFSARLRRLAKEDPEFHGLVAAAAVALALFWPQSSVQGYAPTVFQRLYEMKAAFGGAGGGAPGATYSPLHQRYLIWLCAWTMGAENPLTGKGFGLIELFYPFYQGHFLATLEAFRTLRTHANNAHNELLEVFSQTGIVGLGAAALMWTAFFRRVWSALAVSREADALRAKPGTEGESEPVWALAAAAGAAGMLVDNLLNVSVHFAVPGLVFWWQAGTAMGLLSRREGRCASFVPPAAARYGAALLAAALLLVTARHWGGQWMREALYFNGFKTMHRGDAGKAAELLERAYAWHPREVNTNYELGNAYARSNLFEKAVWAYKEALAANAGYDEIYFNLGTLESLKLGRRDEALAHYAMSWAINPMSAGTAGNYAALLMQRGTPEDRAEAERVLAWGVGLEPANVNFAMTLAGVRASNGRWEEAEAVYTGLLRRQPNFAAAEQGLRQALAAGKRPAPPLLSQLDSFKGLEERIARRDYGPETLALARKGCADFPQSIVALFYLGNLELIHGDPGGAAEKLSRVVAADPGNVGAKLNLGQSLKRLGRAAEAADLFRQVLAADPNNAMARQELK